MLLQQQWKTALGAFGALITVGEREVKSGSDVAGVVIVMAFPAGSLTDQTYKGAVGGMAASSKLTFSVKRIAGVDVSVATKGQGYAMFRAGDHILLVVTPSATAITDVTTALIKANG